MGHGRGDVLRRAAPAQRLDFLGAKYESIGIPAEGRSHTFDFKPMADVHNEALAKVV